MSDGPDGRCAAILDSQVHFLGTLLADVGAGHRGEVGKQFGEVSEKLKLGAKALKVLRGQAAPHVGACRGADHHLGQRVHVNARLEETVEESAIPGEVELSAATQHQRPV